MEITETNEPHIPAEPKGLLLLQDAQYAVYQSGKWANFLAIMGFIGSGFILLCGLLAGVMMSALSTLAGPAGRLPAGFGGIVSFFYVMIAAICFIISRHLYRFGSNIKTGIELQSAETVSIAFKNIHSFFKWKGVILIIILSIYIVAIIGFIIAAAAGISAYNVGGHQI